MDKDGQNRNYNLSINHNGEFIDGNWVGQTEVADLGRDILSYETLKVFMEYYGLVAGGCICYLPPRGDLKTDLEVLKSDDDVSEMVERQAGSLDLELYVLAPFDHDVCAKDPFTEAIRLKAMQRIEMALESQLRPDKGKRPMELESSSEETDSLSDAISDPNWKAGNDDNNEDDDFQQRIRR